MTESQKARKALVALGADLTTIYATLCPPPLSHLAVEIDHYVTVLDTLDEAIERKANLDLIWPRWALWLFSDLLGSHLVCAPMAVLFRRRCEGDPPTSQEWEKAKNEVWEERVLLSLERSEMSKRKELSLEAASAFEADASARVQAAMAAWSAGSAEVQANGLDELWEAETAVRASEEAGMSGAARVERWIRMAEKLAQLLNEAP